MPAIRSDMIQCHVCRPVMGGEYEHLVLQRAPDEDVYPNIWQVVTGMIEPGETATAAARREVLEETGIEPVTLYVAPVTASFYAQRSDSVHIIPVFAAIVSNDAVVRLSREHQSYAWLDASEAQKRLLIPSHRESLRVVREYIFSNPALAELLTVPHS